MFEPHIFRTSLSTVLIITFCAHSNSWTSPATAIGHVVAHQAVLAKRLAHADYGSLTGLPTADLTKRPFLLFWFMALIQR